MISVQIEYPQQLVDQVEAAIKDRPLMGFVPGAGPNHPAVMLVGEAPAVSYTHLYDKVGLVVSGNTIEELAQKLSMEPATLKKTVATWNQAVKDHDDQEFSRTTGMDLSLIHI